MADKIDFATVSYILGVLSVIFAFVSPVAGLIIGIVGITQSKRYGVSRAKKLNTVGIVLSIIFLLISIAMLVYSVNSGLTSFFPSV